MSLTRIPSTVTTVPRHDDPIARRRRGPAAAYASNPEPSGWFTVHVETPARQYHDARPEMEWLFALPPDDEPLVVCATRFGVATGITRTTSFGRGTAGCARVGGGSANQGSLIGRKSGGGTGPDDGFGALGGMTTGANADPGMTLGAVTSFPVAALAAMARIPETRSGAVALSGARFARVRKGRRAGVRRAPGDGPECGVAEPYPGRLIPSRAGRRFRCTRRRWKA